MRRWKRYFSSIITESGIYKIGQNLKFEAEKNDGKQVSGLFPYRPIILGNHIFHLHVEQSDTPIIPNTGYMSISRITNNISIQHFVESMTPPIIGNVQVPKLLLNVNAPGDIERTEIAFRSW